MNRYEVHTLLEKIGYTNPEIFLQEAKNTVSPSQLGNRLRDNTSPPVESLLYEVLGEIDIARQRQSEEKQIAFSELALVIEYLFTESKLDTRESADNPSETSTAAKLSLLLENLIAIADNDTDLSELHTGNIHTLLSAIKSLTSTK